MQAGFPIALLPLVRCSTDAGALRLDSDANVAFIESAIVRCRGCSAKHYIHDGILSLLRPEKLHPESVNERQQRDAKNDSILAGQPEWNSPLADALETTPTLRAVDVARGMSVLELGCGTGRYTVSMSERASAVVAVDFSLPGLQLLRQKLPPGAGVGLVQADVTGPYAAPQSFDRVLSTLHSNLPNARMRMAALQQVAGALKPSGRAVMSMHHYSGRDVLARVPADGRYPDSGIYRYYLRKSEARAESAPYFRSVRFEYLYAGVPGLKWTAAAKASARIPGVRSALARLFLAIAEQPLSTAALHDSPAVGVA